MPQLVPVSPALSISGYIRTNHIPSLAQRGIQAVVCLVPEDDASQPNSFAEIASAARDMDMPCVHLPVVAGSCDYAQASAFARVLEQLPQPAVAYCRNGARPITLWAINEVAQSNQTAEAVIRHAVTLGYDVSAAVQAHGHPHKTYSSEDAGILDTETDKAAQDNDTAPAPPPAKEINTQESSTQTDSSDAVTEADTQNDDGLHEAMSEEINEELPLAVSLCSQLMVGNLISADDVPQLAALGVQAIICQLPKTPEYQQHFKSIDQAARTHKLLALHQPAGIASDRLAIALGFHRLLRDLPQPAFAYHISADLSATLWAMAQVEKHKRPSAEVLDTLRNQGLRILPALQRFVDERDNTYFSSQEDY